ncbi:MULTISPECIES: S-layer homology domain-containing protein [unclassified Enterococcus]|jgi:hypothetical protein|uniref:S-layer homology domain-containing protein n=1 Tax=unclassified Enterococcus TaxID=2608891 RepID=UPI003D2A1FE0
MKKSKQLKQTVLFFLVSILLFYPLMIFADTKKEQLPFTDVDPKSWAYSSIVKSYENGWISGTSPDTFSPKGKLTRAQFITILGRYSKIDPKDPAFQKSSFQDIDYNSWGYAPYVSWAEANKIANGTSDTTFSPQGTVTRAQIAVFFSNYVRYRNSELIVKKPSMSFSDEEDIPSYAKAAVSELAKAGVISGSDGKFMPNEPCTREMYAAFLVNFDNALKQANFAPEEPVIDHLEQIKGGSVQLDWHTKGTATVYWVYRKKEGGDWEKVASTKETTWLDKEVLPEGTYQYTVSACNYTGTKYLWSTYGNNSKSIEVKKYESDYEEINPDTLPFNNTWVGSKYYNDATKNYYLIRSYLDYLDSIGGGTLVLDKGTYTIPYTINIPSSITLRLKDGAVINQSADVGNSEVKPSAVLFSFSESDSASKTDSVGNYDGVSGSKIIGEGFVQINSEVEKSTFFLLAHTQNIQLENLQINANSTASYGIKVIGSKDININDSTIQSTNSASTAILIDPAAGTAPKPAAWSKSDNTVSQNIQLKNNTISGYQYGIRTMNPVENEMQSNILIDQTRFVKLSKAAIEGKVWKDAVISNSEFTSIGAGAVDFTKGGVNAIVLSGAENSTIIKNQFDAVSRAFYLTSYTFESGTIKEPVVTDLQIQQMKETNTVKTLDKYYFIIDYTEDKKDQINYFKDTKTDFILTESSTPYRNKYSYTEETRIYWTLRSYLDQIEENGGGKITISSGNYDVSNVLYIPSNTTIEFQDNVLMKKTSQNSGLFVLANYTDIKNKILYHGYEGVHDVTITAPENSNVIIDNQSKPGVVLEMGHTKNVAISNITFKNMYVKHHFIELDASENTLIEGCGFINDVWESHYQADRKEAINLDVPDPNTGGFSGAYSSQDNTKNNDITIRNNHFKNLSIAIGTHMYTPQSPHTNVKILSNLIENCTHNAIKIMNWESPVIEENKIKNIGEQHPDINSESIAFKINGVKNPVITNNEVSNADYIAKIDMLVYGNSVSEILQSYAPVYNEISADNKAKLQANKTENVKYNKIYYRNNNSDPYEQWDIAVKK